jgi:Pvc16 N-terminal domain
VSTALGISAVTAVLENLLNGIFNPGAGLGTVTVSAVAPDIIQNNIGGNAAPLQINLFLHQVTPNGAWRNMELPSLAADGSTRLKNQPLALDLHYLLTAYASTDCEAEALLGFAVQFMHENPVLARSDIRNNLGSLPSNPALATLLSSSGLADQIEMIKIIPATLGREEMAWLWTALKADYRPTFPFQVSVVLIQAQNPSQAPLPVTSRNVAVQAGLLPSITSVVLPTGQSAACQGDTVTVNGGSLGNAIGVILSNAYLGIHHPLIAPTTVVASSVEFQVPNDPTGLPAGFYSLSIQVQPPSLSSPISTNSLPLAIAAKITSPLPASVAGLAFTLNPTCSPPVLSTQDVSLVVGTLQVAAVPFTNSTSTPTFNFTNVPAGIYLVRLRVDGIDSPITYIPAPGSPVINVT